jgi:hypothetical protein
MIATSCLVIRSFVKIGTVKASFTQELQLKFAYLRLHLVLVFDKIRHQRCIQNFSHSFAICVKLGPVTDAFYLKAQVNVQPYFQYLLSDFAENWLGVLHTMLCRTGKFHENRKCHTSLIYDCTVTCMAFRKYRTPRCSRVLGKYRKQIGS